jgi:long-chain acyl-CoA synthetase
MAGAKVISRPANTGPAAGKAFDRMNQAREKWRLLFENLRTTNTAYLFYRDYSGTKRRVSYADFANDVITASRRLRIIQQYQESLNVGILAGISYNWLVIDLACFFGGHLLIALPEKESPNRLKEYVSLEQIDLLIVDHERYDEFKDAAPCVMSFGGDSSSSFDAAEQDLSFIPDVRLIRQVPAVYFSSGTSGHTKRVEVKLTEKQFALERYYNNATAMNAQGPLRSGMLFLLYLPLSGLQQRGFIRLALFHQLNIIISSQHHCLQDVITERPHVMVSVPAIYEVIAKIIALRLRRLPPWKRYSVRACGRFPLLQAAVARHRWYQRVVRELRALYGGRAEYFVSGSAPISRECLLIFRSLGVRIYEGYGLSEAGIIALNTQNNYRLGSVGKPRVAIRISEDSEILVKFDPALHDRRNLKLTSDGYIATGDLGRLDRDGFLFVKGRMDEVWVLGNGYKVLPHQIEQHLLTQLKLAQVFAVRLPAMQIGVVLAVGANPLPKTQEITDALRATSRNLNINPGITRFLLQEKPWSTNAVFFTSNLKLKRSVLESHFSQTPFQTI